MESSLFWELFWYSMAGVGSTIASQGGYSLCFRVFSLSNVKSKILSWIAAATTAFVMTRYLVFAETESTLWECIWKFYFSRIGTVALTVLLIWLIMDKWLKWDLTDRERVRNEYGIKPELINLSVTVLEVVLNYFIAKFMIF